MVVLTGKGDGVGPADPDVAAFAGPGEMRALFRSTDWSATSLGPVASWSPILRLMVEVCLDSGFPVLINWGPELVALYNDAFAPMMGAKHPIGFGESVKQTWPESPDSFDGRLGPVLQGRTVRGEDERQILERNGFPEEVYFTFSHSPIRDADGDVVGIFTASTETTAKIVGERRMRVVRELGGLSAAEAGSTADTCRAALEVLQRTRESVPFALAFLRDADGRVQRIADYGLADPTPPPADDPATTATTATTAMTGSPDGPDRPESPGRTVGPGGIPADVIDRVLGTGVTEIVTGLRVSAAGAFLPGPIGPLEPDAAVVMPLKVAGGRAGSVGVLAVGVNPYRPLDEEYQGFFTLVRRQVGVALTDAVAYESQRQQVQVLADLDRAKMEFFQNVSHELRTPLTLLLAPLQDLLAASGGRTQQERDDLEAAVRAAERLRRLVDALLDFSGAEAGTLDPDLQPTDLGGLTADVASMFRSTAEHAGLRFGVEVPPTPVTARVDRAMWSTIVTNLLSNAVKYTQQGGIDVLLAATDDAVVLTISDTGSGIPADERDSVFRRFFRSAGGGRDRGAGIGLALVADLVKGHDGRVDLDSTPGQGTKFTVTLPLTTVRSSGNHPALDPPDGAERPRLLLIEDDDDLRAYLTRLLSSDGWAVQAVADAEAALTATADPNRRAPELVLTDVMLPGRSGLQVTAELRNSPRTARLPIIMLTARGGSDAAAEGLAAGADDYITKPFSSQELLARVRANHELHELRESAVDQAEDKAASIRTALDSNRVIGTAIGIVMAGYRLTAAQGFQLLAKASQHSNRKLREIAAEVVDSGKLPLRPTVTDDLVMRVTSE